MVWLGLTAGGIAPLLEGKPPKPGWATDIGGIFIGGSKSWKWEGAERWVKLAHRHSLKCHIGGVGTIPDLKRAHQLGADSVDSSNWSRNGTFWKLADGIRQRTLSVEG